MSGIQVFVEYKVLEEKRTEYMEQMESLRHAMEKIGVDDFQVYEGVDQPGLFVEMFHVPTVESYRKLKRKRCEEPPGKSGFWQMINPYVSGGTEKIHMWAFAPVIQE
ncbi:MFS transporter [Aneurinibacillus terranovensis]|uniref:MFS transporter n=1 Tax=Aneurinibacillus terranovensis TaxID=278991 RepID=UPI0003F5C8B6|nr:MFS transporter [Aneurinibacillus terranovensis]